MERSPRREAAPASWPSGLSPATPSLLYRSAFAEECEALRAAVAAAGEVLPPPSRLPSTIEAETLTPLWPASPASSSSSSSPSLLLLSEASPAAAPAAPRSPNRTYDHGGQATFLCPAGGSPEEEEEEGGRGGSDDDDDRDSSSRSLHRTFEWEPPSPDPAGPPVTSTPAAASASKEEGEPSRLYHLVVKNTPEASQPGSSAPQKGRQALAESGSLTRGKRPASVLASKGHLLTMKKRRRLSLGAGGTAADPSPAPKGGPKGTAMATAASTLRQARGKSMGGKPPRPTGLGSAGPRTSLGGTGPSHPLAQKQLPHGMRNSLIEPSQEKKSALSSQTPSQGTKKPALRGSLACRGLKHQGENRPPGTKLPVPAAAGGPKTGKMGAQKHTKEKEPESAQKQALAKRVSQGTGLGWKHTGGPLLTAGQTPRTVPGRGSCLQCRWLLQENQRLAKEIQQLKTLLEKCQCRGAEKE